MKKTFEFKVEEDKYILINTNPNEKRAPFEISKHEMKFDTSKFYQYIFEDIDNLCEIKIVDMAHENDKDAKRVCKIVSEIVDAVIKKMNEQCFVEE